MNRLTIDFETRSPVDLRKTNSWVYAEHPETKAMCLALKKNGGLPYLWVPEELLHLYDTLALTHCPDFEWIQNPQIIKHLLKSEDIIEAHNLEFEISLWTHKMVPLGFPDLREEPYFSKLRCSASVTAYHALPRALGKACKVLGLANQKDDAGHKLMLKMCKPRKPRKAEREADPDWESKHYWHETPEDLLRQAKYCAQDVNAEYGLATTIGDLPPEELEVWRLDQKANWTGVCIDTELVQKMQRLRDDYTVDIEKEFFELTGFAPSQVLEFQSWLTSRRLMVTTVDAPTITELLQQDYVIADPEAYRALELRQAYAKTSLKKLDTAIASTNSDGRMRSNLMYSGAGTHRWSGKGMQLQNLPSRGLIPDIDQCRQLIESGADIETFKLFYPDVQMALSSVIRNVVTSSPGHDLYAADFSAIEGRDLAWLAGEEHILQAYRDGLDMYKIAATTIYPVKYEDVTKDQRQIGKIPELAGGYGGGWRAYMAFAVTYGMKPPQEIIDSLTDEDFKDWQGTYLTGDEAAHQKWWDPIVKAWRANRQATVNYWYDIERTAKLAIQRPGEVFECRSVRFGVSKDFLQCLLPSGRVLYYYQPDLHTNSDGKQQIVFQGANSQKGGAWMRSYTYGGKLVENITQSIARDMMAEAMLRIDRADTGLKVLFTVHDEIVCEGPKGCITLDEYCDLMKQPPEWAAGCPIDVDGWVGEYYRK